MWLFDSVTNLAIWPHSVTRLGVCYRLG